MNPDDFDDDYKTRMIQSYPVIAGLPNAYRATLPEREAAFERILANQNLRRTHEMYLEDHHDDL